MWTSFVPVALHVDYWNYLGWKDRFSSADYSARQRRLAGYSGQRTVYTPGFMLDGREWKQWWNRRQLPAPSDAMPGELNVMHSDKVVDIRFQPNGKTRRVVAHVALLGFGLETEVERGENAGRTLTHDFVVLSLAEVPLAAGDEGFQGRMWLDPEAGGAPRTALAVWVSAGNSPLPLQATGGWLD